VGWTELSIQALYVLAFTKRDAGDLDAAAAALDRAIDVCERAGLIAQSIQATGMRAVILALDERAEDAREAAEEATELAESLHYPVGNAAALEACGMASADPEEGAALLVQAAHAWQALDRPLEAARSRLLAGRMLLGADPEGGRELLDAAAVEIERLGVLHLAERARALAAAG
jgi:hypothetical protein